MRLFSILFLDLPQIRLGDVATGAVAGIGSGKGGIAQFPFQQVPTQAGIGVDVYSVDKNGDLVADCDQRKIHIAGIGWRAIVLVALAMETVRSNGELDIAGG